MWIIQEQNALELWNKLHFEEKKTEIKANAEMVPKSKLPLHASHVSLPM